MSKQLKTKIKEVCNALWCHRAVYAGLAAAYGAGCLGWIDKETVNQIVTGLYVALVAQRGH